MTESELFQCVLYNIIYIYVYTYTQHQCYIFFSIVKIVPFTNHVFQVCRREISFVCTLFLFAIGGVLHTEM